MPFEIAAFYRFKPLSDAAALRAPLQALCDQHGIRGTLLVAPEGINGTLAGQPEALAATLQGIRDLTGIPEFRISTSFAETLPFLRLKVRLKTEIVTLGDRSVDPNAATGIEIEAKDWNALISDPDVIVVDTRNAFEVATGSFVGAIDPETASFGNFPDFVQSELAPHRGKKIAMFCTGGIRCEKASSLLLREGFDRVYQLKGGILAYLEQIPERDSLWQGSCFVFDGRVAVGHGLVPADVASCHGCRHPLTPGDRASADYEEGVSCPHCAALLTPAQKASARERHRQVGIAAARGAEHLGTAAQSDARTVSLPKTRKPSV